MIRKDADALSGILDDSFIFIHMTGTRQPKAVFIQSVLDGTTYARRRVDSQPQSSGLYNPRHKIYWAAARFDNPAIARKKVVLNVDVKQLYCAVSFRYFLTARYPRPIATIATTTSAAVMILRHAGADILRFASS